MIQKRGAAVIAKRKLSSALSAAKAAVDHVHDWLAGTKDVSLFNSELYHRIWWSKAGT